MWEQINLNLFFEITNKGICASQKTWSGSAAAFSLLDNLINANNINSTNTYSDRTRLAKVSFTFYQRVLWFSYCLRFWFAFKWGNRMKKPTERTRWKADRVCQHSYLQITLCWASDWTVGMKSSSLTACSPSRHRGC